MPAAARHPGRRPNADASVVKKHEKIIADAIRSRKAAEKALDKALDSIAQAADEAMRENVQTNHVAEQLGVTRQAVYKLVQERVYGKERKPPTNGTAPKTSAAKKKKEPPKRAAPPTFKSPRKRKES